MNTSSSTTNRNKIILMLVLAIRLASKPFSLRAVTFVLMLASLVKIDVSQFFCIHVLDESQCCISFVTCRSSVRRLRCFRLGSRCRGFLARCRRFLGKCRGFLAGCRKFLGRCRGFLGRCRWFLGRCRGFLAGFRRFLGKCRGFLARCCGFLCRPLGLRLHCFRLGDGWRWGLRTYKIIMQLKHHQQDSRRCHDFLHYKENKLLVCVCT